MAKKWFLKNTQKGLICNLRKNRLRWNCPGPWRKKSPISGPIRNRELSAPPFQSLQTKRRKLLRNYFTRRNQSPQFEWVTSWGAAPLIFYSSLFNARNFRVAVEKVVTRFHGANTPWKFANLSALFTPSRHPTLFRQSRFSERKIQFSVRSLFRAIVRRKNPLLWLSLHTSLIGIDASGVTRFVLQIRPIRTFMSTICVTVDWVWDIVDNDRLITLEKEVY